MADKEKNDGSSSGKNAVNGFGKKILSVFDKGVSASKKGIQSAGSAISDFGDKSVLRIEKTQLQGKADKAYAELGKLVYGKLSASKSAVVSASDEEVKDVLSVIKSLLSNIAKHEAAINDGKKPSAKKTSGKADEAEKSAAAKPASAKSTKSSRAKSSKAPAAKATSSKSASKTTAAKKSSAAAGKTGTKKAASSAKTGTKKTAAKKADE